MQPNDAALNKNQVCITGCWYDQISLIVLVALLIVCINSSPINKLVFSIYSIFHIYQKTTSPVWLIINLVYFIIDLCEMLNY